MQDWLAWRARLTPDRAALVEVSTGQALSYRELDARVEQRAVELSAGGGVGPGDRVALLCDSRVEVFELLFACAKLGAALAPLNYRLAGPELRAIVADCEPAAFVHDAAWADLAEQAAPGAPDARRALLGARGGDAPLSFAPTQGARGADAGFADADPTLMVLYTSGTTGTPKGAMLGARQVLTNAVTTALTCELGAADRCLAFLPLFHTGGLGCLAMPTLYAGGAVVIMERFDAPHAVRLLQETPISTVIAVPAMYNALLEAGLEARPLPSMKAMLCGGAPCPDSLIERMHGAGLPLRQGYGLTEAGPNCFTLSPLEGPHRLGTVGMPTLMSEARLVDDRGREVAPGQAGELLLRGPHVMKGYLGNPAATAAALDVDGWLHTGDVASRDEHDFYSIVGRKKEMFISGGENVYPAEVERVLLAHPAVHEAAVLGVPDPRWGEVGAAALVLEPEVDVSPEALRAWCRERLAGYKTPGHYHILADLPVNATGKVHKPTLRARIA